MSTFADIIMRSNPSNLPESEQIWSSTDTLAHLKKFVDIHVALAAYKRSLMNEAQFFGTPVTRPLLLHFGEDETARSIYD